MEKEIKIEDELFEIFNKIESANNPDEVIQILNEFDPEMVKDYLLALGEVHLPKSVHINKKDMVELTKKADRILNEMNKDYSEAAISTVTKFQIETEAAKIFHEQVQILTKNLSSLNTIYELELQESNNHLKALNQFYSKLNEASAAMSATAEDAAKAKEKISTLANNLGKLNQIYGNMIDNLVSKDTQSSE